MIFKIWTFRWSKNTFTEPVVLLTVLNQLWKCVVFVTLHSSSPWVINIVYKLILFQCKYCRKKKKIRLLFFVLVTALMCSDSTFNLLKRVTYSSFLFLCKMLVFLFLPFLILDAQIMCSKIGMSPLSQL